jgi:hypothetical protein
MIIDLYGLIYPFFRTALLWTLILSFIGLFVAGAWSLKLQIKPTKRSLNIVLGVFFVLIAQALLLRVMNIMLVNKLENLLMDGTTKAISADCSCDIRVDLLNAISHHSFYKVSGSSPEKTRNVNIITKSGKEIRLMIGVDSKDSNLWWLYYLYESNKFKFGWGRLEKET